MKQDDFKQLKTDLKLTVALLTEGFKDLFNDDKLSDVEEESSAEVGEMIEDIELKKFEKMWSREFICPLCNEHKIKEDQIAESGTGLAKKMLKEGKFEVITEQTPRTKWSFEDEETFDRHMKEVHGISVDRSKPPINDKEILRDYGAHYQDFRHSHKVKGHAGLNKFVVSSPEHNVKLDQQAMDELMLDSFSKDTDTKYIKKVRTSVSDEDVKDILDELE